MDCPFTDSRFLVSLTRDFISNIFGNWGAFTQLPSHGYGSIPINTIFSGMNIYLPAILMFTRGTRFWHTARCNHCEGLPSEFSPCIDEIIPMDFPIKTATERGWHQLQERVPGLVNKQFAMENGPFTGDLPIQIMIFHSYFSVWK